MTALDDRQFQHTQNVLRRALGLPSAGGYIWDGHDLHRACEHCGQLPPLTPPPMPPTDPPVQDVVRDVAAPRTAALVLTLALQVVDRRRPESHIVKRVHPRVLRYVRYLAEGATGEGGTRLLSLRSMQPWEGALEVAASVQLAGRRRALAASFDISRPLGIQCDTFRIL